MLNIKSLPDSIERPVYGIELVNGNLPTFEAGEMVELIFNAALGEQTIRKIVAAQPVSGMCYPIFRDTADNVTITNIGRTAIIMREWYGETDQYEDGLAGAADGTMLTVSGDVNGQGAWNAAGAGQLVFGRLKRGSALTPANGGIIEVERISSYVFV